MCPLQNTTELWLMGTFGQVILIGIFLIPLLSPPILPGADTKPFYLLLILTINFEMTYFGQRSLQRTAIQTPFYLSDICFVTTVAEQPIHLKFINNTSLITLWLVNLSK